MSAPPFASDPVRVRTFRLRLMAAMMVVVVSLTAIGLFVAQRQAAVEAEHEVQRDFRASLDWLKAARETRMAALSQRCSALVQKARIHAALEDDALDLLYPNARDELADLMADEPARAGGAPVLHAKFWRFLDLRGAVIPPAGSSPVGSLSAGEMARLALPRVPTTAQLGYLARDQPALGGDVLDQIITTPIVSIATGRPIAALVVGFASSADAAPPGEAAIKRGLWSEGRLQLGGADGLARATLIAELQRRSADPANAGRPFALELGAAPHLVLFQRLNDGSAYPTAYEVCLYPLAATLERQRHLRWQIVGLGSLLLVAGLAASHFAATKLSRPVERLAADSARTLVQRDRAKAALELTQAELQRATRFSSDASHQLKTPIAVFRASLEELLVRTDLTDPVREELTTLVNQTYRFTGMIDDLLLLSRLEEGRLKIEFAAVNLNHLVASWLDDLSVRTEAVALEISTDLPADFWVAGERRFVSLILQNLLENARKYNRPGGRIRVGGHAENGLARLTVGNTGPSIPVSAQPFIFDRFHRGAAAEDVPGHGLGLNLARELARLHGGDVRLTTSAHDWTEFEVSFRLANPAQNSIANGL